MSRLTPANQQGNYSGGDWQQHPALSQRSFLPMCDYPADPQRGLEGVEGEGGDD